MYERAALVTGANKGIGKHVARLLAAEGLTVYVGSRDPGRGQRALDNLPEGGCGDMEEEVNFLLGVAYFLIPH
jgi:NAD(P)-dependent dehydrogenase (short-subunit alcohol dehydrogenase family)